MRLFDRLFGRRGSMVCRELSAEPEDERRSSPNLKEQQSDKELEAWQPGVNSESSENAWEPSGFEVGNIQGLGSREQQEDSFAVFGLGETEAPQQSGRGLLAVVADGMGGMADGKGASECAVQVFRSRFLQQEEVLSVPEWLYGSVYEANAQVFRHSCGASGSTLAAAYFSGKELFWLSVGDSAIFLKRGDGVFQLNQEHNYLNQLYSRELEEETIDKARAEQDEDGRRLTSFVGIDHLKEVDLNLRPWILQKEDVILLCSDGISGVLTPPELIEAMSLPPEEGCALLETMVLEKKLSIQDNYTGVMIACH